MTPLEHPEAISAEECIRKLQSSFDGLTSHEAKARLKLYGLNKLPEEKRNLWALLFRQFNNLFFYILIVASIISLMIGEWTDFFVINFVIVFNVVIGFWQELKADLAINALKKLTESQNKVLRDEKGISLCSTKLVPGDVVILHEGEIVTADLRLLETSSLMVDESILTGESFPVEKDAEHIAKSSSSPFELYNMLFAGTTIVRGHGRAVVVRTGLQSYLAKIADKSLESPPETPLIRSLNAFAKRHAVLLIIIFLIFIVFSYFQDRSFQETAYVLIAGLVSAVPEGLPLVVTLALVIGALSLSKKNVLVRYLPSVETLGSATIIASDKTNTITEGKLIVSECIATDVNRLKLIAALCNDADEGAGDPLDVALFRWVENSLDLREKYPRCWSFAFDSAERLMATEHTIEGTQILFIKGAFEALKEKAKRLPQEIENAHHKLIESGLRVIAFGQSLSVDHELPDDWDIEVIGLIGFIDPPKQGVKEAVQMAKKAHIRLLMITGDHPKTALNVGKQVAIFTPGDKILTGSDIENLHEDALDEALKNTTILARALPENKYEVVKHFQGKGEVVAVSGDGVNDVPALRVADLGIAMGNGSEAAKTAAKMVITDNNLSVIVDAIKSGRVIANNIHKIIYYLISSSIQEMTLIFLAIVTFLPLPLSAVQILWINIVTGGIQDKCFAFTKAEGDVMKRRPVKPEKKFFGKLQIFHIFYYGLTAGVFCYVLYFFLLRSYDFKTVSTMMFASLATTQFANAIQSHKDHEPFFKNIKISFSINPWIYIAFILGLGMICFSIYVVPEWFHCKSLTLREWIYPLIAFCASFMIVEVRKWVEWATLHSKE